MSSTPSSDVLPASAPKGVAVLAIHGISPIQRYAFQDQFATALRDALNRELEPPAFETAPYWPWSGGQGGQTSAVRARALRLYRCGDDPETPEEPFVDVHEGYWSPLSKGKVNAASMAAWLFRCLFLAASATASIPAGTKKLRWDIAYVARILGVAALLAGIALAAGLFAFSLYAAALQLTGADAKFLGFAASPFAVATRLPWPRYLELALYAATGFVVFELAVATKSSRQVAATAQHLASRAGKHLRKRVVDAARWHTWARTVLWMVVAILVVACVAIAVIEWKVMGERPWISVAGLIALAAAASLQGARRVADFAIENVLGDVQVYTTHDTNAANFAVREQIIDTVTKSLLAILRSTDEHGRLIYDRIHIAGHSLGSTIGMDVLLRIRQLVLEQVISDDDWLRIRSFTTFGTALEKTRFLLDVRQPTPSAAYDQFQNDLYGDLFSQEASALEPDKATSGIYWLNVWYERDIVANEIVTYRSDVKPRRGPATWAAAGGEGDRLVCNNVRLAEKPEWTKYAFIHGNYIGDERFWDAATPVIRHGVL